MGGDPTQVGASGTGVWKTPLPPPVVEVSFEGKVERVGFDHFGDFESFTVLTGKGKAERFESREKSVEKIARRALKDWTTVLVVVEASNVNIPESIVLLA
jgi:hypothetical protein